MQLTLTLIPDDPDAPTLDLTPYSITKEEDLLYPWTEWSIILGQYTTAGRHLREATQDTITGAAGWQAVISDEDGSVVASGELDDVQHIRTKYKLTVAETDSSAPDFFN